jgi:hypothetical protein
MQCNQRRAVPDRDDGRVWQNLGQHAVDFRFQLLVKRRCRLIQEQPIRLVKNSPRYSQPLLLAARTIPRPEIPRTIRRRGCARSREIHGFLLGREGFDISAETSCLPYRRDS